MINIQVLAPNGASDLKIVHDTTVLPSALDARTAEANGGLHSLDEFVQHHAEEIHLLAQECQQVMHI